MPVRKTRSKTKPKTRSHSRRKTNNKKTKSYELVLVPVRNTKRKK